MTDEAHHDPDWQAFRYIAAEMTPEEVALFEERLSTDQQCREALARAVELADALSVVTADRPSDMDHCFPQPNRRGESAWWARIGWIAVGAAATLAGVLLFQTIWSDEQPHVTLREAPGKRVDGPAFHDPAEVQLALLWSRTRDDNSLTGDDLGPTGVLPAPLNELVALIPASAEYTTEFPEPVDDLDGSDNGQTDSLATAPSWLEAAVASELSASDDGTPEPEN